ncbi:MAG: hypothetical protein QOK37_1605 [Thermoanaerobaculia bacterium]|jgi:RHS repeat-associated protein|nr:hypothetical protein [Thermoanaerobaculia bacterium]
MTTVPEPMNTQESRKPEESKDQRFSPAAVSLPKGGGAIKGIGEKFGANPVTGTGSMTIPLPLSPGRSGFTPALALSYDSGAGNGAYGFGWNVGYPGITRRTDRGLPRYLDHQESDVFILSGAEDLVPVVNTDGSGFEEQRDGFRIARYRPRIEGLFARIERWTRLSDPGDMHWRSLSRDNVTTFYGKTAGSRIADPADPTRIFTWLLCESFDDQGNAAVYEYVAEDDRKVDISLASESNRTAANRSANRYLKRVKYTNLPARLVQPDLAKMEWLFELVMDYGDHEGDSPGIDPTKSWPVRPDPFSTCRAGFEVRTYRRCQRFLMFHRFQELGTEPKLVRSLALDYDDYPYPPDSDTEAELQHEGSTRIGSFLRRATVTGYADTGFRKSMPPLELTYSHPLISKETSTLDEASYANLPGGVDGVRYQWLDLNSEGIAGVLSEQADVWWYKPNLGDGHLGPPQLVAQKPSIGLETRAQFLDLAGDGLLDLVQLHRPNAGFFEHDDRDGWSQFTPFRSQPNLEWDDPNLRFVDLTGDGHADVLITEDDVICWYPSLAEDGFGPRESLRMAAEESSGPRLVFHDTTETIFLADMSGDGLSDLVRIRNGEVCYWPNIGYGQFGRRITMDDSPVLDAPDSFDPGRIRLADIDGSGVADIIYLAGDGVRLYFNRSGNGWSVSHKLASFPPIDNVASVSVTDLLGNGTACLVWSSPLPRETRTPLQYVDLMGNQKPHLLVGVENNLGARTQIEYAASTRFYLEDQLADRPWITRLPFPVHVVERTEVYDDISRNRFSTRFAYHHGYFDGVEREFRGFGMVEQRDTEEFATLNADQQFSAATNIDASSHVPPVLTRTWFHTGAHLGRDHVSNFFAGFLDDKDSGEYYREPGLNDEQARKLLLDDTVLPPGLTLEEEREACRALKGAMLRHEIYALNGTDRQSHPYSVTEQNFTIRRVQPQGNNPHAVFFTHPRESVSYHYERIPADPRVAHSLTLEVDDFGNVLKTAAVAYGRRQADAALEGRDQQNQSALHVTYAENSVTNSVEAPDQYRVPLPCEARTYEVTGLSLPAGTPRFTLDELRNATSAAPIIGYEQSATPGTLQKRLIEHARTLYRRNDLGAALPLRVLESRALPFETYKLAFTPALLTVVYGDRVTDAMPANDGRYVHTEGDDQWWIPSGRILYSPGATDDAASELAHAVQHFFRPRRYRDPFGHDTAILYDQFDLLLLESEDALGNRITAGERDDALSPDDPDRIENKNDYRVLQPRLVTDPNGNRSAVSFDAMGMVVGTAVMGKRDEAVRRGDLLDGFVPDLPDAEIAAHLAAPLADPHSILGRATTRLIYDLFAYLRTKPLPEPAPAVVYAMVRETHDADLEAGEQTKIQHSFSYSDGFGREIQKKVQAEPGPVPRRDAQGTIIVAPDGQPEMTADAVRPRWVGSGWTIFNNKGKPVRQFEPFFTDTHRFESDVRIGVSPFLFYDPTERAVATLHPNHTWEKIVFDPWRQESWDVNDTALIVDPRTDSDVGEFFQRLPGSDYLPTWHEQRKTGALGAEEQSAAAKTAVHAGTPTVAHADSLGRTFLTIAHNRFKRFDASPDDPPADELYATRVIFDIEGNQREVIDAKDRVVMRYDYDMLGNRIHQASMDAGERWMLNDAAGKPLYAWDSRNHRFRTLYDALQRPTDSLLREGTTAETVIGRSIYGESRPNAESTNLRGKVVKLFDQAGVVTSDEYDFKGNLLRSQRQLAAEYKTALDWSKAPPPSLETEIFTSLTRYDALNRPATLTSPDNSVVRPRYNEANLLERLDANLRGVVINGQLVWTPFVKNIDYDAKGRRQRIDYGNNVSTFYRYDRLTSRLTHLLTDRGTGFANDWPQPPDPPRGGIQNLEYFYDPAGNITRIRDDAQQTIFFDGQRVEPSSDYDYDAIYRLIAATGREHIGQHASPQVDDDDAPRMNQPLPSDSAAVRNYTEGYVYDPAGNISRMIHQAGSNGSWTRRYDYESANNRLSATSLPGDGNGVFSATYEHDVHGNMNRMPHLPTMQWDNSDQLQATSRQVVNAGTPETTWYIYDAGGQRVRKVTERAAVAGRNPARRAERIYLGAFEVFREYQNDGTIQKLERQTCPIMNDKQRIALVEMRTLDIDGGDLAHLQLIRYQFGNHLGSSVLELDHLGKVISYEEYHPHGSSSYQALDSIITSAAKRYRYTGMERDTENAMSYHATRYYSPWLARWTSCDPAELVEGSNLYAYVGGNPITKVDVQGLNGKDPYEEYAGVEGESVVTDQGNVAVWSEGAFQLSAVETIEIYDTFDDVDRAVAAGTVDRLSRGEFEKRRNRDFFKRSNYWTEELRDAYWEEFPEEAYTAYEAQLSADYQGYKDPIAAETRKNWRRIDAAAGVVNVIAAFTVVAAAGIGVAAATVPGSVVGVGLGSGGTAAAPGAVSSALIAQATTATQAAGGAGAIAAVSTRIQSVKDYLATLSTTPAEAAEFFGWGNRTTITKTLSDFTREGLVNAGWTKERLIGLASTYGDMLQKAISQGQSGRGNPAAAVRQEQIRELVRHFFGD